MPGQSLQDLESISNTANQAHYEGYNAYQAAGEKAAAAEQNYQKALSDLNNEYNGYTYGEDRKEKEEAFREALKAKEEAEAELKNAEKTLEQAAEEAQSAQDAVDAKKEELRASRANDTTFVVHTARAECSFGIKESYLALDETHGVYTRQIPQMVISDQTFNLNVINFCGCKSKENPTVLAAAERAAKEAQQQIEEKKTWRDSVVQFFCGKKEIKVTDSLIEESVGECITEFPSNINWLNGHSKVTVNEKPLLLRRCELKCRYGGNITILLSGQPE